MIAGVLIGLAYEDVGRPVTDAVGGLALVGGLLLYLLRPREWRPRWYRERLERGEADDIPATLVLYRTGLAFAPLEGPNELLVIPGHELRQATAGDGAVIVDLADGARLRFRVRSPARAAKRIARTLRP